MTTTGPIKTTDKNLRDEWSHREAAVLHLLLYNTTEEEEGGSVVLQHSAAVSSRSR